MTSLRFAERLSDLVDGVEVILSDIWGVVHNGLESFPEACEALHTYRQRGGTVILITNAPRPADSVQRQLRKLGVADETYDAIVSSGDLTRHIVAERGDRLIYCAGAVAELYRELGGEVIFYGKPHRPIYERAMALAAERRGSPAPLDRVLAIGDSVRTDLTGAHGFGIDCLFVTRGIHSEDFEGIDQLDPASVKELFGHPPRALMRELRW